MKHYRYKYLRASAKKPNTEATFWEDDNNSTIFILDSTSNTTLLYSTDEGANWSTAGSIANPAVAAWHDRDNDKIYFVATSGPIEYVDTSNPAGGITEVVDASDVISDAPIHDIFMIGANVYITCHDTDNHDDGDLCVYTADEDPIVFKCKLVQGAVVFNASSSVIIDDQAWFVVDDETNDICRVACYDESLNTVVAKEDCDAATSLPNRSSYFVPMTYDENDIIQFRLIYDGDGKYYLCSYSIGEDEFVKGSEHNISIMGDRNTDTSLDLPFNLEKAFHTSSYFVYQITKNKSPGSIYMIDDLNFADTPPAAAIDAISDTFLFADDKLYKLTDMSDELTNATCVHKFQSYSSGFIGSTRTLGSDQVVRFYDDNDLLWFQGKILKPINYMNHYSASLEGLSKSDLNTKISVDYSTTLTDVHTIAKACIDALPDYSHLWYDASSMPDPSVTMMVKFMNRELKDCLNVLAKAINGIWWVEPSGYTWLLKLSSVSASGLTYTQGSFNWSPPVFWKNLQLVNRVQVFGHFGLKSEVAIDQPHQQKYGIKNWYGEDDYPSIHDQEVLNDFAIALLALGGAANNALRIKTTLLGVNKIELGESISIQDTNRSELADATAYAMLRLTYDCLKNKVVVIASNNVVTSLGRSG